MRIRTTIIAALLASLTGVCMAQNTVVDALNSAQSQVKAFAALVADCGLNQQLSVTHDQAYSDAYANDPEAFETLTHPTEQNGMDIPTEKLVGFTLFPETDDVYRRLGLMGSDGTVDKAMLKAWLQQHGAFTGAEGTNYKDKNNWLNQFVTYHILPMRIEYDHLVIHYNEIGYKWNSAEALPTITQSEWYQTLGAPRLLKLSDGNMTAKATYMTDGEQAVGTQNIRLNYFEKMDRKQPWADSEIKEAGILVRESALNSTNGAIYPINDMLCYSAATSQLQASERMRYDVCSLLPEMMTNNLRRLYKNYETGAINRAFSNKYQYFENLTILNDKQTVWYLPGYDRGWHNYQGDEFNITGQADLLLKLPPVPQTGIYELRMGNSANSARGIYMFCFGNDKNNMVSVGLPCDMRVGGQRIETNLYGGSGLPSYMGYEKDTDNDMANAVNDLVMRSHGMMKAPASYCYLPQVGDYDVMNTVRNKLQAEGGYVGYGAANRVIIGQLAMQAGEIYYLRIKGIGDNKRAQLFLDYIELCPESVYDNADEVEDIW